MLILIKYMRIKKDSICIKDNQQIKNVNIL